MYHRVQDEITFSLINFKGAAVEACEWINNFIPHFTEHVITYPCWYWSWLVFFMYPKLKTKNVFNFARKCIVQLLIFVFTAQIKWLMKCWSQSCQKWFSFTWPFFHWMFTHDHTAQKYISGNEYSCCTCIITYGDRALQECDNHWVPIWINILQWLSAKCSQ